MDERVDERFTGQPDPIEQLLYGFSLIGCLPDGGNAEEISSTQSSHRRPARLSLGAHD